MLLYIHIMMFLLKEASFNCKAQRIVRAATIGAVVAWFNMLNNQQLCDVANQAIMKLR